MVNAIIKGLFYVITSICGLILSPIISVISNAFPSLGNALINVTAYFTQFLTYVPLCLSLLGISREPIIFLFDYYIIKYYFYIAVRGVRAIVKLYNKLKV